MSVGLMGLRDRMGKCQRGNHKENVVNADDWYLRRASKYLATKQPADRRKCLITKSCSCYHFDSFLG